MGLSKHKPSRNYPLKTISALVASVCSFPVLGLELGRLQIQSGVGEPLRAEIDVLDISNEELRSLKAQIASPGSFRQAGLEFNPSLAGVTAILEDRSNGRRHITLKGENPVMDTFVDVILELQWSSGKLVKNYALLLNTVGGNQSGRTPSATGAGQDVRLASTPPEPVPLVTDAAPATQSTPQAIRTNTNSSNVPVYRFTTAEAGNTQASQTVTSATVAPSPVTSATQSERVQSSLSPRSIELNQDNIPVYRFTSNEGQATQNPTRDTAAEPSKPALQERRGKTNKRVTAKSKRQATDTMTASAITVKRGDTASQMALRQLSKDVNLDQMLLAMLKANPGAFIDGNVNLIKAGATLNMPTAEDAAQIPAEEARRTVMAQARDFAEYARRLASSTVTVRGKNTREMTGKVVAEAPKPEVSATQPDKLTLSTPPNPSGSTEEQLAKEQERQDASAQLAALSKNLQDLESLAKIEPPKTEPSSAAPVSDNPAAPPSAATESPTTSTLGQPIDSNASISDRILENKQIWGWAAGLLAAMLLFIFWMRRTAKPIEDVHAPSYNDIMDDFIDPASPLRSEPSSGIPAQMASIDLNLQAQEPVTDNAFAQPRPAEQMPMSGPSDSTQVNKLNLASELLVAGDIDLARSLITSVASTAQGDIKVRALQMLGQIK